MDVSQENYFYAVDNCGFKDNSIRSEGPIQLMHRSTITLMGSTLAQHS